MVAEIKKGRYVYYNCTDGKGTKCREWYTREERLTTELTNVLGELAIPQLQIGCVPRFKVWIH